MKTVNKYTRTIGNGQYWNTEDGCTVHIVEGGYTKCGVRIGSPEKGWDYGYYEPDCKRCLKAKSREAI